MSALDFLTTEDPLVEGARSARVFLEEMFDEKVISIVTPHLPDDRPPDGQFPGDYELRKQADKEFCLARAAARSINSFRAFVVSAIKDAYLNRRLIIATAVKERGVKTPAGAVQVWFEGTTLEFALTPYQRKQLKQFVQEVLPVMEAHHLPITDELMSLVVADDAAIKVPEKVRYAISLFSHERAKKGLVSAETAKYAHKVLNDDSISPHDVKTEVLRRTGQSEPVLIEGTVEMRADGTRVYYLVMDNDVVGEVFEKKTSGMVDWRFDTVVREKKHTCPSCGTVYEESNG